MAKIIKITIIITILLIIGSGLILTIAGNNIKENKPKLENNTTYFKSAGKDYACTFERSEHNISYVNCNVTSCNNNICNTTQEIHYKR